MSNQKRVTALPPTLGIKDPDVKMFLDALTNAWDQRSGNTNPDDGQRFITKDEFSDLATKATIEFFAGGVPGSSGGSGQGGQGSVAEIIGTLADQIKKTYLYQLLGTEFEYVDIKAMNERLNAAIADAKTGFKQERIQRESSTEAMTQQITVQASRIDGNVAAITTEQTTRSTKDNALASAINNIWASVGGSGAVIQDGALASITPSGVQATRWNQVQAAVTDPNTGQVSQTSIKQDLTSYANTTNGLLRSTWSVRVESQVGGRAVVGGVGLSLDNSGGAGPTIDFGVRADRFWIGDTFGNGDLPFIVSGGQTFIKNAMIQNASIDGAKIGNLTVDAINIKNQALTDLWATAIPNGPTFTAGLQTYMSVGFFVPATGSGTANLMITATLNALSTGGSAGGPQCWIYVDGYPIDFVGVSFADGFSGVIPMVTSWTVSANAYHTVEFRALNATGWTGYAGRGGLNVLVAKK